MHTPNVTSHAANSLLCLLGILLGSFIYVMARGVDNSLMIFIGGFIMATGAYYVHRNCLSPGQILSRNGSSSIPMVWGEEAGFKQVNTSEPTDWGKELGFEDTSEDQL